MLASMRIRWCCVFFTFLAVLGHIHAVHGARHQYTPPTSLSTNAMKTSADPVDLGTTLVAIKYKDGVVVAADTRTSVSSYVSHRFAYKIVPVVPDRIVVCRSGSAADTQQLATAARLNFWNRQYRHGMMENTATTSQVAHWLRHVINGNGGADSLSVSLIVAGYDADTGGSIWSLSPSGALIQEGLYAVSGSGSTFVYGYLDHHLSGSSRGDGTGGKSVGSSEDDELTEEQAIECCKTAVGLAIGRDKSSGGLIRIVVLNGQGCREITSSSAGDVHSLVE